ncbi:hypothetical protein [Burkholderia arboris]|uniref:hypothetical protein n=1 Tax=Burkholderia arboris TaxID=488730 RepID=UPI0015885BD5|nr:hypothetical protein [Burkholderia arboris]MCA8047102.1 hypothetical protein [Burkholderia arboris]
MTSPRISGSPAPADYPASSGRAIAPDAHDAHPSGPAGVLANLPQRKPASSAPDPAVSADRPASLPGAGRGSAPHGPAGVERSAAQEAHIGRLSDAVIASMVKKFPSLADNAGTLASIRADLKSFTDEPVVASYLFNADGTKAVLEGTPKGDLAPDIEFQKTIGSFVALQAMMKGVPIFGGDVKDSGSLEVKLSGAVDAVNARFQSESNGKLSGFEPLRSILGAHDVMKSADKCAAVQKRLADFPAKVGGTAITAGNFSALDHDTKLSVAMQVMSGEVGSGRHAEQGSLTRQFFSAETIRSGRHMPVIEAMKAMWGLGVNGLQLNQGECQPAQLHELVRQVKAGSGQDFEKIQSRLLALAVHESTDLLGAANPFLPVLPRQVIDKAWSAMERLRDALPAIRENREASVETAAKALYMTMLPSLNSADQALVAAKFPGDRRALVLATRIASLCRLDREKSDMGQLLTDGLDKLRQRDKKAFDALLGTYGDLDNPVYLYYGPALIDNVKDKFVGQKDFSNADDLSGALSVVGKAADAARQEIDKHGGPMNFQKATGADFVNLRDACLAVAKMSGDTLRDPEKVRF